MKKNRFYLAMGAALMAGCMLCSCGQKKADNLKDEATDEAFELDAKDTAAEKLQQLENDSLKQMEEMVAAVETPVKGINGTPYNADFFNNAENEAASPSAGKYVKTKSGLKYVIVKEGSGQNPKASDTVTVHYVGELTDGQQFDSSLSRGEPTSFPLNAVIPGWTEGLQLMKPGGVAVFYLPSNLAYGERGVPNPYTGEYNIPPSAPLIFWVQLLEVN